MINNAPTPSAVLVRGESILPSGAGGAYGVGRGIRTTVVREGIVSEGGAFGYHGWIDAVSVPDRSEYGCRDGGEWGHRR